MTEEEESLNKLKYKTIETGTLEDTIEATNDNIKKWKKLKSEIKIKNKKEKKIIPNILKN